VTRNCGLIGGLWPAMLVLATIFWATAAPGAGLDPFSGSWRGGGSLILTDGSRERVRCRANVKVSAGGAVADQSLKCTSTGHGIHVKSTLRASGTKLRGTWTAAGKKQEQTGALKGSLGANLLSVALSGGEVEAALTIALKGCKQTVTLSGKLGPLSKLKVALNKKC
jgi:hypothetical protein